MHRPGRPTRRPRPGLALTLGGILLSVAACGQPAIATPTTSPAAAVATLALPSAGPSASPGDGPAASPPPIPGSASSAGPGFPGGFLIADRGNGRLLAIDRTGRVWWRFPTAGSLPAGQSFAADDAFLAPDGLTIVANDEAHQVIDRINIATRRVVWQYGHYDRAGSSPGYLHTPDDAYPLANGDIVVADIENCRVMEISPAKRVVTQWGTTRDCALGAPATYGRPNGDTPLPDGGILITEITGSRVVRLAADGPCRLRHPRPCPLPIGRAARQRGERGRRRLRESRRRRRGEPDREAALALRADGWRRPAGSSQPGDAPARRDHLDQRRLPAPDRDRRPGHEQDRLAVRDDRPARAARANHLAVPDGHQPLPPGISF